MSWNKPSSAPQPPPKKSAPPALKRGLLAGLIVVALGALCLYLFSGGDSASAPGTRHQAPRTIKEVTPARAPTNAVAKAKPASTNRPPQRVGETRDGWVKLPNGKLHRVHGVTVSGPSRVTLASRIFKHDTDIELAEFMTIEPGTGFLGDSKDYFKNFDKVFLRSLEDKIEIDPKDSDEVKALKQGVIDMRRELKARYDAGEDINQVLRDTREQYRELGLYREELGKQIDQILRDSDTLTEKDLGDLVGAANKMLEERGAKPFRLDSSIRHKFRMYSRKRKAEAEKK